MLGEGAAESDDECGRERRRGSGKVRRRGVKILKYVEKHTKGGNDSVSELEVEDVKAAGPEAEAPARPPGSKFSREFIVKKGIPWIAKGGLAIADYGLISGSNFLLGVLLARWLSPEHYGAYA